MTPTEVAELTVEEHAAFQRRMTREGA